MKEKEKSQEFIKLCKNYQVDSTQVPEIITYKYACQIININSKAKRDNLQKTIIIISAFCKAMNWKANYNISQYRWYTIHKKEKAGLVFSVAYCEDWTSGTLAYVGSPFVLPNKDCAVFVGKHFIKLFSWKFNHKIK